MEHSRSTRLYRLVSRGVGWALLGAVVGFVLLILAAVGPAVTGRSNFIVLGGSMEPNIRVGSVVVTEKVRFDRLQVGDVITYVSRSNEVFTHRIVDLHQDQLGAAFRTRGDANASDDPEEVRPANVLGRVWYSVPWAGYFLHYASQDMGRIAIMAFAVGVALSSVVQGSVRDKSPRKGTGEMSTAATAEANSPARAAAPDPEPAREAAVAAPRAAH
jgi:signal peptidase